MLQSSVSQELEDEEELMRESRLLKKLKAGKITEADFDARMDAANKAREKARDIAHKRNGKHSDAEQKKSLRQRRTKKKRRAAVAIQHLSKGRGRR